MLDGWELKPKAQKLHWSNGHQVHDKVSTYIAWLVNWKIKSLFKTLVLTKKGFLSKWRRHKNICKKVTVIYLFEINKARKQTHISFCVLSKTLTLWIYCYYNVVSKNSYLLTSQSLNDAGDTCRIEQFFDRLSKETIFSEHLGNFYIEVNEILYSFVGLIIPSYTPNMLGNV